MGDDNQRQDTEPVRLDYASPAMQRPQRLVKIAAFADEFEANLALNYLESERIRCVTTGQALLSGVGPYIGAMRRVDLLVDASDQEAAEKLLADVAARRAARLDDNSPSRTRNIPNERGWIIFAGVAVTIALLVLLSWIFG